MEGAAILVNTSLISRKVSRSDVRAYYVPAGELAQEAGSIKATNIVMLGAYMAASNPVDRDIMLGVMKDMFASKSAKLFEVNKKALELGEQFARENA